MEGTVIVDGSPHTYLHRHYASIALVDRLAAQASLVMLPQPDVVVLLTASGIEVGRRIAGVQHADTHANRALQ
jgi:hypothetical protein